MDLRKKNLMLAGVIAFLAFCLYVYSILRAILDSSPS